LGGTARSTRQHARLPPGHDGDAMDGGEAMISGRLIAGIGCRRGTRADDIVALVRQALAAAEARDAALAALATPRFKAGETGIADAAAILGVRLALVDEAALRAVQPRCATRSPHAE